MADSLSTNPGESAIADEIKPDNGQPVSLMVLALVLFRIGATTFGGLFAGTQKLEKELVDARGWLTGDDLRALIVAATLIPAPKFLAFGGMIGFRLRKWPGSIVALCALLSPPALFVLAGASFLNPEQLGGPMPTLQRAVTIAVIGLLIGNAFHQLRSAKVPARERFMGILLGVSVAGATILGVPLIVAALVGLTLGVFLIRRGKEKQR